MIGCDYHDDTGSYIDSLVSREPPEIVSVASLSQSAWIEPRRYITSDKPQPTPSTVENMSTPSDQLYQLSVQDESTGRKLTLELTRTGLTMHKLLVESSEFPTRDVLCGPESSSSFKTEGRKFMNQIVGRYANRLPAGKSILIDSSRLEGKDIELNLDENEPIEGGRGNCLHSGYDGYDLREFERGLPEAIDILANVTLELSPATEGLTQTIPSKTGPKTRIGRARFSLKAKLSDPEEVAKRNAGTPINLTWHTGYILNDFREEPSDPDGIHQHKLWINSDRHLAVHESQLPTGEIHSNEALGIDFSTPDPFSEEGIKPIGETMPSGGFDQCFLFKSSISERGDNSKVPKAILRSPKDDLILVFYSNQTAVQCYSANYFNGLGSRKELHRRSTSTENSGGYKKQEAIYLEFQEPSSLCTNLTLQKNLKSYLKSDDHGQHQQPEEKNQTTTVTNTILYPNQVYSNWFFIDIFI
ncbi:hypothetical protein MJO28_004675 [Puccinia striiformis f. sp. tritici]|uniref:Uncharacterized protein n=1 Tax=Puccinia striiformis f. sp. tritici TaxID=168172 RepID=A0ACC0ER64_9BASI|nr:hypothetical protein MJO28_004675 [Puccinia striiformis f. sp. tritici]